MLRTAALAAACSVGWFVSIAVAVLPAEAQVTESAPTISAELAYVRPAELSGGDSSEVIRVTAIPAALRESFELDPFYSKVAVLEGIPIIGSEKASDYALLECAWVIDHMLSGCDKIKAALVANKVRIGIIAATEYTMDLPENQNPRMLSQAAYHDRRSRGLGGVWYATCGEENLLSLRGDPYGSENITIHEFAHTIASNLRSVDRPWWDRLEALYEQAIAEGLWANTYAATNVQEYWAEATQSWFDCNNPINDGRVHNGIWNRERLRQHDPRMAAFLTETFGDRPWRYTKITDRSGEDRSHLADFDRERMPTFNFDNSPRIQADPRRGQRNDLRDKPTESAKEE